MVIIMYKKFLTKSVAVFTAVCCIASIGCASANAAVIDDEFESVSQNGSESISSYSSTELPQKYSSKDLGFVTGIKKQDYNNCWAYAGISAFETKLLSQGIDLGEMSPEHLNFWATTRTNGKGWQRRFSDGGFASIPAGYFTSWQGGVKKSDVTDIDFSNVNLAGNDLPTDRTEYGTTAIKYLTSFNTDEIKQSIMDNGAVFTSYASANSCYSSSNTSYFMPQSYNGSYEGHSIEIVGWDDTYSLKKFNGSVGKKPQNNGAWLVRNSWGDYNSLGGYFWISYEDKYLFGSKYDPSYTIEQVEQIDKDTMLLQNEIYGATYSFQYIIYDEITYINRFDFDKDYKTLDKVVFETRATGADYQIYYIPTVDNAPTNDKSKWTLLDSGVVNYSGYICCDINDLKINDSNGSIGVTINTSDINQGLNYTDEGYTRNNVGVGEWLVKSDNTYAFINESQSNQSYLCINNEMSELLDWYKTNFDDDLGGTLVIKAIMEKDEAASLLGDVNLDNSIDIKDATEIQKYAAEITELNSEQFANADVNNDGTVNVSDATEIQKMVVNS